MQNSDRFCDRNRPVCRRNAARKLWESCQLAVGVPREYDQFAAGIPIEYSEFSIQNSNQFCDRIRPVCRQNTARKLPACRQLAAGVLSQNSIQSSRQFIIRIPRQCVKSSNSFCIEFYQNSARKLREFRRKAASLPPAFLSRSLSAYYYRPCRKIQQVRYRNSIGLLAEFYQCTTRTPSILVFSYRRRSRRELLWIQQFDLILIALFRQQLCKAVSQLTV